MTDCHKMLCTLAWGGEGRFMRTIRDGLCSLIVITALLLPGLASAAPGYTTSLNGPTATTTDSLNLRSGPGLSFSIVTVLPAGSKVALTGLPDTNGFRSVSFQGNTGWAFSAYLAVDAAPPSPNATATTTDALNLRSGAALTYPVVTVLPVGSTVTLTGQNVNGFRSVTYQGYSGWAYSSYLNVGGTTPPPPPVTPPVPEATVTTTDALNLRTGPGTSFAVIQVIPAVSRLILTGQTANGFSSVSYNGRTGWASTMYLTIDGTVPEPATTATATEDLNMRSGPATSYAAITVIPRGSGVTLTGQTNNGFHSVSYNGYSGWAFSAFLDLGSTSPPSPPPTTSTPPATEGDAPFDVTNAIVGPARGDATRAMTFARAAGAVRMDEVERYVREIYRLAPQIGFDPALLVAQSALETGNWRSDWWLYRLNPAGIGVTGDPAQNSDSPTFADGTMAARGQIAHMHAEVYGRSRPLPEVLQGVDPTYQRVFDAGWAGTIRTLEDLAGTWAADPHYDAKLVRVANEIF